MGWIKSFKEGYQNAEIPDPTVAAGRLAEIAAQPLPQLAADLFGACFAPGMDGWTKGLSQSTAGQEFLKAQGWQGDQPHVADALMAEAFQLLEHRSLIALHFAEGGATVHLHWYITRSGRVAAQANDVLAQLER